MKFIKIITDINKLLLFKKKKPLPKFVRWNSEYFTTYIGEIEPWFTFTLLGLLIWVGLQRVDVVFIVRYPSFWDLKHCVWLFG